jgi:hypothetical protein
MGIIAFLLGTWLSSDDLFRRVEVGLLASSVAAVVSFAIALRYKLAEGVAPDTESMFEAITDMPFEA